MALIAALRCPLHPLGEIDAPVKGWVVLADGTVMSFRVNQTVAMR